MKQDKIILEGDQGEQLEFYAVEQTRIGGRNYLLVADGTGEDAEAVILRDDSADTDEESVYVFVEDEQEFEAVSGIFQKMLDEPSEDEM